MKSFEVSNKTLLGILFILLLLLKLLSGKAQAAKPFEMTVHPFSAEPTHLFFGRNSIRIIPGENLPAELSRVFTIKAAGLFYLPRLAPRTALKFSFAPLQT